MSVITSDWCGASSALALCPASRFQIEFAARCTLLTLLYFCRDLPLGLEFLGCGGGGEISYGCSLQRVSFELLPWQLLLQLLLLLHVAAAGVGCPKPFALTSLGSRIVEQHQVDFRPSLPPWRKLSLKYCTQPAKASSLQLCCMQVAGRSGNWLAARHKKCNNIEAASRWKVSAFMGGRSGTAAAAHCQCPSSRVLRPMSLGWGKAIFHLPRRFELTAKSQQSPL